MLSSPQKTEDYHTNVCKNIQKKKKISFHSSRTPKLNLCSKTPISKSLIFFFIIQMLGWHHTDIAIHNYILQENFKPTYIVLKSGLPSNAPSGITEIELL